MLTPVTTPVPDTMVATPGVPLLHVPPDVAFVSVFDKPIHTSIEPAIVSGFEFTVTTAVLLQPVDMIYVIVLVPDDIAMN